ncbi:MAG: response regulator [Desulfobacterium sp.]|nr:response regulator [Desulfobacterium sp.]
MIKRALHSAGFTSTLEAEDGKQVLDLLMEQKVDLIISGINMPKVNGIELLRALKNHYSLKVIPFIALLSDTQGQTYDSLMAAKPDGFIKKPFTNEELTNKVNSILGFL